MRTRWVPVGSCFLTGFKLVMFSLLLLNLTVANALGKQEKKVLLITFYASPSLVKCMHPIILTTLSASVPYGGHLLPQ